MSGGLVEPGRADPAIGDFTAIAPAIRPIFLRSALRLEPRIVRSPSSSASVPMLAACYHRRRKAHNAVPEVRLP